MNIFLQIEKALKNNFPFVVYNKPNSTKVKGFFQKNTDLYTSKEYNESGFIFAPFNDVKPAILIPEYISDFIDEEINLSDKLVINNDYNTDFTSEKNHIKLVEKGIEAIEKKLFKKVVLSRKEKVDITNLNTIETFKKLLLKYPTAFVYIWFHPKVGIWLGATPETLVKIKNNDFTTMSLAGTQVYNKETTNISWKAKEIEEQQLVTDYITDKLLKVCKNLKTNKTETIKAGNLLHLRSIITGEKNIKNSILIKTLHPTPAVCGLPLQNSKKFILENENYDREFYTGFLGEINLQNNNSELFVNLRCMKIDKNIATIFVGGGITKDSNPKMEWQETVAKTNTMKSIF